MISVCHRLDLLGEGDLDLICAYDLSACGSDGLDEAEAVIGESHNALHVVSTVACLQAASHVREGNGCGFSVLADGIALEIGACRIRKGKIIIDHRLCKGSQTACLLKLTVGMEAVEEGLDYEIAYRPKKAAQYGTGIDKILRKRILKDTDLSEFLKN